MISAERIVEALIDDEDDVVDPKSLMTGQATVPKEVTIVGRRWFQPTYGNTYHTATISVDDRVVGSTERQYGYGDGYIETGLQWLEANGYVPKRDRSMPPRLWLEKLGVVLHYYAHDVKRQRDL